MGDGATAAAIHMDDGVADLPVLRAGGLSASVAGGQEEKRARADSVAGKSAGRGAVQGACKPIPRAPGKWDTAMAVYPA